MNTRSLVTLLLGAFLILLLMGVALVMTFTGSVKAEKYSAQFVWQLDFPGVESMKVIDLTGDGHRDIFLQNQSGVQLVDSQGNVQHDFQFDSPLVTTLGDTDQDGVEDILVYSQSPDGPKVTLINKGAIYWEKHITALGLPVRAAVIRFDRGSQIILGDQNGQLLALANDGRELWRANLSSSAIRGLDDAKAIGQTYLAAADRDGSVALLDERGQTRWSYNLVGGLRRLRAYDLNGDGNSEVLLGGESGQLVVLETATGMSQLSATLGQAITEIREVEIDGDPASREFVAGGKNGGVWAYHFSGKQLWSTSVSEKVNEIAGLDVDGDGSEEVFIGDDSGAVTVFTGKSGQRFAFLRLKSGVNRIDSGKVADSRKLVIADGQGVHLISPQKDALPPLRFAPLLVGLVLSGIIITIVWFVATIPPKPTVRVAFEEQSPESLHAQRRMVKESIGDVERLKHSGEITTDAYLARLRQLREQLAENETALRKANISFTPETVKCPNCGGALLLGLDRCEYCGQVVIS